MGESYLSFCWARNRARCPTTNNFAINVISFASSLLDTCPTINIVINLLCVCLAYKGLLYKHYLIGLAAAA